MDDRNKRATAVVEAWGKLDRARKDTRGSSDGLSFYEARKVATGYAQHRVFNGGFGAWCGGWGTYKLYDSTVVMAVRTSLNGFMSYLISPTQRWFKLTAGGEVKNGFKADDIYGLNDYFEICQQEILKMFNNTNFYSSIRTFIADGMVQGTAALLIHDHTDGDNALCYRTIDPAEFCIDEDIDGNVNVLFRQFDLGLDKAYKRFGERLPRECIEAYKKGDSSKRYEFIEAVFPRGWLLDRDGVEVGLSKPSAKGSDFIYLVAMRDFGVIVDEGAYRDFPFAVQRWERVSEDTAYGVGLVMRLLPEIKTLNKNMKLQLLANEKLVNPPITVPMMMRDFDSRPGAVNFGDPNQAPQPLRTVQNYDGFATENARLRQVIYEGMYSTLFDTLMRTQNAYRTATEVNELKSEALSLMAATLNNLQAEVIIPLIKRTYKIMREHGLLPECPKEYTELFGEELHIELEGPLVARMREYVQKEGLTSGLSFVAQVAQMTGDPSVLLNVDIDEAVRQGATANGLPQVVLREKQDVARIKEQQAQAQQQVQQAQEQEAQSRVMANLGNAGVNVAEAYGLPSKGGY